MKRSKIVNHLMNKIAAVIHGIMKFRVLDNFGQIYNSGRHYNHVTSAK
jgi:hypothetical protein